MKTLTLPRSPPVSVNKHAPFTLVGQVRTRVGTHPTRTIPSRTPISRAAAEADAYTSTTAPLSVTDRQTDPGGLRTGDLTDTGQGPRA